MYIYHKKYSVFLAGIIREKILMFYNIPFEYVFSKNTTRKMEKSWSGRIIENKYSQTKKSPEIFWFQGLQVAFTSFPVQTPVFPVLACAIFPIKAEVLQLRQGTAKMQENQQMR